MQEAHSEPDQTRERDFDTVNCLIQVLKAKVPARKEWPSVVGVLSMHADAEACCAESALR